MTDDARAILQNNVLGSIATINEDGSPWSTPVHVFYDEANEAVYWFSHETTVHSQNVARDARVSLTLFSPDESQGPKGVYINGQVEKLDVDKTTTAKDVVRARLTTLPPIFETATAYMLKIGTFNSSKSTRNCWYFYT
jgi:uncharacterized protein YhbP (UPF0306 family)